MYEPDSPPGSLSTAEGTGGLGLAAVFWTQPRQVGLGGVGVGLDGVAVGQAGQAMSEGAGLSDSFCWDLLGFWARAEE